MTVKPKLVVLTSRFPFPLEKGDKLRAYYQIKEFSKKYDVYLFSTNETKVETDAIQQLNQYCKEIHIHQLKKLIILWNLFTCLFTKKPFQAAFFYDAIFHRKIKKKLNEIKPDHIFCQQIRVSEYVKDYHFCKKTLDYMDALSKGMERRILTEVGFKKIAVKSEYRRLLQYEQVQFSYFEFKSIISKQDQNYINHPERSNIYVVPNGIETEKFEALKMDKKYDFAFVGNLSYNPNIKAIEQIDAILRKIPQSTCIIAGADLSSAVQKIADKNKQIHLVGYVNDIRNAYCSAKYFLAPMSINIGMQNKILEAMSLEIPVITSKLANNAINAIDKDSIIIAETIDDYVEAFHLLERSPDLNFRIISKAKEFILNNYTWENTTKIYFQLWS